MNWKETKEKLKKIKLLDQVNNALPFGDEIGKGHKNSRLTENKKPEETNEIDKINAIFDTPEAEEPRERVTLILNECHVPESLEQRTLQAMAAMREVQAREAAQTEARKEAQKAVLRESRQFDKKTLLRGSAIAAALLLAVTLTPLRNFVANAADSVYHAFHNAEDDVLGVNIGTTINGIEVETLNVRLSNEFVYLTLNENYNNYAKKILQEREELSNGDLQFSMNYVGNLSDNKGNTLSFDNGSMVPIDHITAAAEDTGAYAEYFEESEQYTKGHHDVTQYKIYLPGLKQIINSERKKYTLKITCSPQISIGGGAAKPVSSDSGNFTIRLGTNYIESVLSTKVYEPDYSYTVRDIKFDFQKLYVGSTESNFVVELLPTGNLSEADLANITDARCFIGPASDEGIERDREMSYQLYNRAVFDTPAFCSENYFTPYDANTQPTPSIFVCNSHYYMIVTCQNIDEETRYNYQEMLETVKTRRFRIFYLSYSLDKKVIEDDTLYSYSAEAFINLSSIPTTSGNHWDDVTFREIPTQTVSLGKRQKNEKSLMYFPDATFAAGDIRFHLLALSYDYWQPAENLLSDMSVRYQTASLNFVFDDIYIPGSKEKPYFNQTVNPNYSGDYMITEIAFIGKKKRKNLHNGLVRLARQYGQRQGRPLRQLRCRLGRSRQAHLGIYPLLYPRIS